MEVKGSRAALKDTNTRNMKARASSRESVLYSEPVAKGQWFNRAQHLHTGPSALIWMSGNWLQKGIFFKRLMYQSIPRLTIPPGQNPRAIF